MDANGEALNHNNHQFEITNMEDIQFSHDIREALKQWEEMIHSIPESVNFSIDHIATAQRYLELCKYWKRQAGRLADLIDAGYFGGVLSPEDNQLVVDTAARLRVIQQRKLAKHEQDLNAAKARFYRR